MKTFLLFAILAAGLSTCSSSLNNGPVQNATARQHPANLEFPRAVDTNACSNSQIIHYNGFTVSYNHSTLIPDWVAYELTADELQVSYSSKSSNFSRDPNLKGLQASREDYAHSGWDKGHMAPKADLRWSEQSYWQSHYFTNVCPQDHNLNGGEWNRLEQAVRRWAKNYGRVWIVCGPLFNPSRSHNTIGRARVHIPDAFFKALLIPVGNSYASIAYIMPNGTRSTYTMPPTAASSQPRPNVLMPKYALSVDELEKLLNFDLFSALDDNIENTVEASTSELFR